MIMKLKDKIAIVTGGAKGIGAEIAKTLPKKARSSSPPTEQMSMRWKTFSYENDVTDIEGCKRLYDQVMKNTGISISSSTTPDHP